MGHVVLDEVLAGNRAEDRAGLLGVEAEVVDEVPLDGVVPRLVAAGAVDPDGLFEHSPR